MLSIVNGLPKFQIPIVILEHGEGLPLPKYATTGAAGADLYAAIDEADYITIQPHTFEMIPTGIALELPHGMEAQVRPRSGLAVKNGITVLNSPGTIDSDYRGEISVCLINHSDKPFVITRGMRIAQLVIGRYICADWNILNSLGETDRGCGGFGSTGVQDSDDQSK